MAGSKLIDRDRGLREYLARVERLAHGEPTTVKVGILASGAQRLEVGLSNVALGAVHEFGAPSRGIPERSFLRATTDARRDFYLRRLMRIAKLALKGKLTMAQGLGLLGAEAVGHIQARISRGIPPPLAEATIARKGSSRALVDTGQLRQSITWALVKPEGAR